MYNKSQIMSNAWAIKKSAGVSMSVALKAAWAVAKAEIKADTEGKESGWNYRVHTNDWVKYGKNRTYVSYVTYTNAWNRKTEPKICQPYNLSYEIITP